MAAVIRLKRRVDEDPLNAFVLNCKRQRTEPDGGESSNAAEIGSGPSDETAMVLKFAGTFDKADNIPSHLRHRLTKKEAEETVSRVHRTTIASRNRAATRQNAQNNRFRIVNCTRSLSQSGDGAEETTIVDVERDSASLIASEPVPSGSSTSARSENRPPQPRAATREEPEYVYDLYVVEDSNQQLVDPHFPENWDDISVAMFADPLYTEHRPLFVREKSTSDEHDSEDSNDENNWRNDYPDEDDDIFDDGGSSIDEEDIRAAVADLDFDGERELSSDDEDYSNAAIRNRSSHYVMKNVQVFNKVAVSNNVDDDDYDDDDDDDDNDENDNNLKVDATDVTCFGIRYARYKARLRKEGLLEKPEISNLDDSVNNSNSS